MWLAVYCPGLADIQQLVLVLSPTLTAPLSTGASLVMNGSSTTTPVSRRVAGVGHRHRVADRLAGRVRRAARHRSVLVDVQGRALRNRHRGVVGVRTGLVAVGGRRVVDVAVAAALLSISACVTVCAAV